MKKSSILCIAILLGLTLAVSAMSYTGEHRQSKTPTESASLRHDADDYV